MIERQPTDWDDAYSNARHIEGSERWPAAWDEPARAYRDALATAGRAQLGVRYGEGPRNRLDLFLPEGMPRGLVVFVHGGYWLRFDCSSWSHLAAGANARGHAVAIPSYTLCPEARIGGIVAEVARAIEAAAAMIAGAIHLTGHSAGGHLVARMVTTTSPLDENVRSRVATAVPISGLHDLRPLMRTAMNETLRIDLDEAHRESPALLEPLEDVRVVAWVGGKERPEFVRQSELLGNVWAGLGADVAVQVEPGRHHFDVIEGLGDSSSVLMGAVLGE